MAQTTVNEAIGDFTHYIKLDFADLKAIGTGNTKTLLTLPAGSAVDLVGAVVTTAIAGTTSTSIEVGYSGTTAAFIAALDADAQAVNTPVFNTGSDFVQSAGNTTVKGGSLPVKIVATATPVLLKLTDANLASMTAGVIIVGLRVINLARFA
jgi:hypothetical protein